VNVAKEIIEGVAIWVALSFTLTGLYIGTCTVVRKWHL
jgi:hypothetical protein